MSNGIANRIAATNNTFTPVIVKSMSTGGIVTAHHQQQQPLPLIDDATIAKQQKNAYNLGRLDGLVSAPSRCSKIRVTDSKKITAILLETNIVELQRHLLTITVQNQVFIFFHFSLSIVCHLATSLRVYIITITYHR